MTNTLQNTSKVTQHCPREECRDERTRSWNIGEGTKFEEHRDGWSQEGKRRHGEGRRDKWSQKVENLENWKNCENDEETICQSEERLCKSIMRGFVNCNHEKHAMMADVGKKEQDVIDDITGKELPWHAEREARELELKYLRDLGVYEKVDEKEAVEKYGITPVDTKRVDTDKACKSGHE